MAKCYFAKHKLVWEVLEGGLKSKIEIQWSDIMALNANCPDDGPGTLNVVVMPLISYSLFTCVLILLMINYLFVFSPGNPFYVAVG